MMKLFAALLVITGSFSAQADILVTNLTKEPRNIVVIFGGNNEENITIDAGRTWRTTVPYATLRYTHDGQTKSQNARERDHFAIWPNGTFAIQQRRRPSAP